MSDAVLEVEGLHKAFGGVQAVRRRLLRRLGRRDAGADRPQRRRQDHLLQHAERPARARCRHRAAGGPRHHRPAAARRLAAGRRPHLPDHRHLRLDDACARTCRWRCSRMPAGCARCCRAFGAAFAAEADALLDQVGMLDQAERACGVLAYGDLKRVELAIALANEPRLLLMDEPTAGMAPHERVALMALTAAAGARAQHRRALHRARHGRGLRPCRPHHRARPRPADRRRHAGGSARQSRTCARSISGARTDGCLMLQVKGLHAFYGRAHILHGVSLEARAGEVVALLGRNGAGKSTTMKAIMGLVPPAAGEVTLRRPAHRAPAALSHRAARPRLRARGAAHLHRAHGDGEPRGRPPGRPRRGAPTWTPKTSSSRSSPTSAACATGRAGACRAASSRC